MKTKSFIWLLTLIVFIILGSSLFYRLQLLLGEKTSLTTESFFNPFLPQNMAMHPKKIDMNLFDYQNPFDPALDNKPYRNPFEAKQ